jgi:hypothetical protein
MMAFFEWLEYTALADWVAASLIGYPMMLSTHAVGLAIVVGVTSMMSFRFLGMFKAIAIEPFRGLFLFTWIAFFINFLSGFALFSSQATYFITAPAFIVKMLAIIVNAIILVVIQIQLKKQAAAGGGDSANTVIKICSFLCLAFWSVAIIAGRLIAYL